MVYALDGLNANVDQVEACMQQLRKINSTTTMLALNARIEAERAGTAGAAFRVVASEVRELSKETQGLTGSMGDELTAITGGIARGHDTLKRVATVDMSQNVLAKERLEVLLTALLRRNDNLTAIVAEAATEAGLISEDVGAMVTGLQFQDKTRQRLEHIVDTLNTVDRTVQGLKAETDTATMNFRRGEGDQEWVRKMLDGFKLGEVRTRFVEQVFDGDPTRASTPVLPAETGTIELF